jgi:hypothetical protein
MGLARVPDVRCALVGSIWPPDAAGSGVIIAISPVLPGRWRYSAPASGFRPPLEKI